MRVEVVFWIEVLFVVQRLVLEVVGLVFLISGLFCFCVVDVGSWFVISFVLGGGGHLLYPCYWNPYINMLAIQRRIAHESFFKLVRR